MSQAKNQGEAQKNESKHFNLKAKACESVYFILLMLRDRLTRCLTDGQLTKNSSLNQ